MNGQQFATCCGIDIIDQFYGKPEGPAEFEWEVDLNVYGGKRVKKDANGNNVIKKTNEDVLVELLSKGHRPAWRPEWSAEDRCYTVVLTQEQLPNWMSTLKKHGFKFVCKWNNSTHQAGIRLLYLFAYPKQTSGRAGLPDPFEPPEGWNELQEAESKPQAEALREAA